MLKPVKWLADAGQNVALSVVGLLSSKPQGSYSLTQGDEDEQITQHYREFEASAAAAGTSTSSSSRPPSRNSSKQQDLELITRPVSAPDLLTPSLVTVEGGVPSTGSKGAASHRPSNLGPQPAAGQPAAAAAQAVSDWNASSWDLLGPLSDASPQPPVSPTQASSPAASPIPAPLDPFLFSSAPHLSAQPLQDQAPHIQPVSLPSLFSACAPTTAAAGSPPPAQQRPHSFSSPQPSQQTWAGGGINDSHSSKTTHPHSSSSTDLLGLNTPLAVSPHPTPPSDPLSALDYEPQTSLESAYPLNQPLSATERAPSASGDSASVSASSPHTLIRSTFDIEPAPPRYADPSDKRELLIYALPFYKKKMVFLPVCAWKEPATRYGEGVGGRMQEGISTFGKKVKDKATGFWQGMGEEGASTVSKKVYNVGQRVVESVSPEERLLRAIPKDVTKIIIFHPSQLCPEELQKQLTAISNSTGLKSAGKAAVAGLFLPIAFGLDLLVIPGIHVLTAYTAWEVAKDTASAMGSTRLTRYLGNDGGSSGSSQQGAVRCNYLADERLDKWVAIAEDSPEGVLTEMDIDALCEELNQEELLQPLAELRRRELRKTATTTTRPESKGSQYTLLKSE